jgi:hypothetical protein
METVMKSPIHGVPIEQQDRKAGPDYRRTRRRVQD